jgi:tetratricopeptide (TPR) repeat protein
MFGWFQPKCPVDAGSKAWIERRMAWLGGELGWDRLEDAAIVLPNDEYFPDAFDGTERAASQLFERTCHYMEQDPSRIDLEFYRPAPRGQYEASEFRPILDWAGLYDAEKPKAKIVVDASHLHDPESLVATYAHELAHAHLLGPRRISRDEKDLELATDLATVFLGMGIFGANVAFRKESYILGVQQFTTSSRQGYLSVEMWAYALALFAWLRNDTRPAWIRYLHHNVRSPCRAGLAYLAKTGDGSMAAIQSATLMHLQASSVETPELPSDAHAGEESVEPPESEPDIQDANVPDEDTFTAGLMHMQAGEWEAAIRAFSSAIERSPKDDEAYQMRSQCLLELGRFEEALADAEKSVSLEPEDVEGYRIRGMARLQTGRFELAISDLSRYLHEEDVSRNDPSRVSRAYYFRGLAHARSNDLRRAIADFSTAITRWPNWPQPYEARADVYARLGKTQRATADRSEANRRKL